MVTLWNLEISEKKREPKRKLFGLDILRWAGGLPHEGVGAEKFGMSLETGETKFLGGISRNDGRDIPEVPEKFENKKSLRSIFGPYFCAIFYGQKASLLRFGWRPGRLRQKIAATSDCNFWCSQPRTILFCLQVQISKNLLRCSLFRNGIEILPENFLRMICV